MPSYAHIQLNQQHYQLHLHATMMYHIPMLLIGRCLVKLCHLFTLSL
jgi:hypothetical protein